MNERFVVFFKPLTDIENQPAYGLLCDGDAVEDEDNFEAVVHAETLSDRALEIKTNTNRRIGEGDDMSEFNKQDWILMHDCINITWQSGAVKSPQMAQGIEQLRAKVVDKIQPTPKPPDPVEKKGSK